MGVVISVAILAILISSMVAMYVDVCEACHEAVLDELWDDEA